MAAIKSAQVRLDELQSYICPSVPFCIPALTVKNVWKLRGKTECIHRSTSVVSILVAKIC